MAFLISGPGQLMFELEHTISMFSSFLLGVTLSAFRAISYFQDEPVCQSRRLIDIYNPGCSNCLCSVDCLLPGLVDYVISNA